MAPNPRRLFTAAIALLTCMVLYAQTDFSQEGIGSYYGRKFQGRRTASGQRFDNNALTCAHRSLPFGTRLRVTNLKNGLSVIVRVTDRGPFRHGRIIDVTYAAAQQLDMVRDGICTVRIDVIPEDIDAAARQVAISLERHLTPDTLAMPPTLACPLDSLLPLPAHLSSAPQQGRRRQWHLW